MRWQEILILSESDPNKDLRDELTALFGILKVKNIDSIPLEQVFNQINPDSFSGSFEDDGSRNTLIDIIVSLNNLIDKVENDIVYLKSDKPVDYKPTDDKAEKDSGAVKSGATKQAVKNIKKGT